jgi:hypothetical protein
LWGYGCSEDYKKAVDIYEKVATASLSNQLLQYSVKDYMFKVSESYYLISAPSALTQSAVMCAAAGSALHLCAAFQEHRYLGRERDQRQVQNHESMYFLVVAGDLVEGGGS